MLQSKTAGRRLTAPEGRAFRGDRTLLPTVERKSHPIFQNYVVVGDERRVGRGNPANRSGVGRRSNLGATKPGKPQEATNGSARKVGSNGKRVPYKGAERTARPRRREIAPFRSLNSLSPGLWKGSYRLGCAWRPIVPLSDGHLRAILSISDNFRRFSANVVDLRLKTTKEKRPPGRPCRVVRACLDRGAPRDVFLKSNSPLNSLRLRTFRIGD